MPVASSTAPVVAKAAPARSPAPAKRSEPQAPPPEAPAKPAPSLADDLFVLGAKPVAEKALEKPKDKPRTAKEALRMRAERNPGKRGKKQRRGPTRANDPASRTVEGESPDDAAEAKPTPAAKPAKANKRPAKTPVNDTPTEDDAPLAKPPAGLWARVKRLFTS